MIPMCCLNQVPKVTQIALGTDNKDLEVEDTLLLPVLLRLVLPAPDLPPLAPSRLGMCGDLDAFYVHDGRLLPDVQACEFLLAFFF